MKKGITKKQAKIEALRISTALIMNALSMDFEKDVSESDTTVILIELEKIGESMYKRAIKAGGDFGKYTGYELNPVV